MKLPKSFKPKKDLDAKIEELIDGPKIINKDSEEISLRSLILKLRDIAVFKGALTVPNNDKWCMDYVFKDYDSGLVIEYYWEGEASINDIFLRDISVTFEDKTVFNSVKYKTTRPSILTYLPGDWETEVERIYKTID